jgi:hypothetical protein
VLFFLGYLFPYIGAYWYNDGNGKFGGILMIIIRSILLILGILCITIGWGLTGPYLIITALYSPLWKCGEGTSNRIQNRPKFISRILARLLDYIILTLFFSIIGAILEVIFPNSIMVFSRFYSLVLVGYIIISMFFFHKTIGDKIFKLELDSGKEDGKISLGQILLRTFFAPVGAVQGLFSVTNSKKYLVHDRVSDTDMKTKAS